MKRLESLTINQPYIALFGSGNSVNSQAPEEFAFIKSKAFVITLNYAPIRLNGHLNMWSDRKVSDFLDQHYKTHEKDCLLLAQEHRVVGGIKGKVDFWFNRRTEALKGNYTIVWALQLLKRYFPEKKVLLFGLDLYAPDNKQGKWYDHFTDYDRQKRGARYQVQSKLKQCHQQLKTYVEADGIINCNLASHCTHFIKRDWRTVLGVHIAQLAPSPLAGAPMHLSRIINKYTGSTSTSVLRNGFGNRGGWGNMAWPYDLEKPDSRQLQAELGKADVVHHHRAPWVAALGQKPALLQHHSPPRGYTPHKTHAAFNGRKLVIAQYHPRFYTDAYVVPNMLDIWDAQFMPAAKSGEVVRIFYSWATEVKGGWSDKGSAETKAILNKIKQHYGGAVEIIVKHNRPYDECMEAKRAAHICIDECVTGSYHLQSLEGCAVGAVTLNNIDAATAGFIQEVTGVEGHPFVKTDLQSLHGTLCRLIDNREALVAAGKQARQWMEAHWDPKKLVVRYMHCYFNVLLFGSVERKHNDIDVPEIPVLQAKDVRSAAPPRPARKATPRARRQPTSARRTRYQAREEAPVGREQEPPARQIIKLSARPTQK